MCYFRDPKKNVFLTGVAFVLNDTSWIFPTLSYISLFGHYDASYSLRRVRKSLHKVARWKKYRQSKEDLIVCSYRNQDKPAFLVYRSCCLIPCKTATMHPGNGFYSLFVFVLAIDEHRSSMPRAGPTRNWLRKKFKSMSVQVWFSLQYTISLQYTSIHPRLQDVLLLYQHHLRYSAVVPQKLWQLSVVSFD